MPNLPYRVPEMVRAPQAAHQGLALCPCLEDDATRRIEDTRDEHLLACSFLELFFATA
jgi:hypothetical protein